MDEVNPKEPQKPCTDIMDLFESRDLVKICAPMVRYSKLQFRTLVKNYNCDLCFTPMIIADSFCKSDKARNNEFSTNEYDSPLVTQFAANTVHDFVGAAHLVSPYCNGADLNCGCPQKWARQQGLGCCLLDKPQLIYDMVRQCRNLISKPFSVSVKMRLKKDLKKSIEICRQLEHCGASFLTVHGRTPDQLTGEVNTEALRLICENLNIPVVANGGVKTLEECLLLQEVTKCKGVMVANGLLTNPSLFSGTAFTSLECVQKWLNICYNMTLGFRDIDKTPAISEKPSNLTFQCFHHHLVFMLEKIMNKQERRIFNNLQSFSDVLSFIKDTFNIVPELYNVDDFDQIRLLWVDYSGREDVYARLKSTGLEDDKGSDFCYDQESEGKYFKSKVQGSDECDWSDIFLENG